MIGGGTCSQLQWNASAAGVRAGFNFPQYRPGKGYAGQRFAMVVRSCFPIRRYPPAAFD